MIYLKLSKTNKEKAVISTIIFYQNLIQRQKETYQNWKLLLFFFCLFFPIFSFFLESLKLKKSKKTKTKKKNKLKN